MDTADLHYALPPSAIAQVPIEPRDAARLLVDLGPGSGALHRQVADLPDLLADGDLLVTVKVDIPGKLTDEQRAAVEALAAVVDPPERQVLGV